MIFLVGKFQFLILFLPSFFSLYSWSSQIYDFYFRIRFVKMSKLFQVGKQIARGAKVCQNGAQVMTQRSMSAFPPPFEPDQASEPFIPPYQPRDGEPVDIMRARLLYQSRKRGMLENGLLLSTFAAKFLSAMSELELKEYDRLINLPSNDWDIYYWATGVKPIPIDFDTPIMQKFIEHVRNDEKETRFQQPDL